MLGAAAATGASVRDRTAEFQQIVARLQQQQGLPSTSGRDAPAAGAACACRVLSSAPAAVLLAPVTGLPIAVCVRVAAVPVLLLLPNPLHLHASWLPRPNRRSGHACGRASERVCTARRQDWHGNSQHEPEAAEAGAAGATHVHV